MPRIYRTSDQLELAHRPTLSMGLSIKQLARITRQYHNSNALQLIIDGTGQLVKVTCSNENGHQALLTDWLEPIETRRYLHNLEQMFRLDRFFSSPGLRSFSQ